VRSYNPGAPPLAQRTPQCTAYSSGCAPAWVLLDPPEVNTQHQEEFSMPTLSAKRPPATTRRTDAIEANSMDGTWAVVSTWTDGTTAQASAATAPLGLRRRRRWWVLFAVLLGLGLLGVATTRSASAAVPSVLAPPKAAAPPTGLSDQAQILGDVKNLVDLGPRRSGTPGGIRAAEYVESSLKASGVPQVWQQTGVTTYEWQADRSKVTVGGQEIDAFPSENSFLGEARADWTGDFSTGPGGRTAQVVDVGNGTALDLAGKNLKGKIVVFNLRFEAPVLALGLVSEFLYDPQLTLFKAPKQLAQANPYITNYLSTIGAIQKAGAVGYVGVLTDYFDSNKYRNEYYSRLAVTMPGFWVTKNEGHRLRQLLATNGRTATVALEGKRYAAPAHTVLGYLPGQSPETVMVQSHHDSVGPGAVEDASGTASVLALARYYAKLPLSQRPRSLLFVTFDTHFTGYQSHQAFGRDYVLSPDRPFPIVANATVEHIAKQGAIKNGKLVLTGQTEPRAFFRAGGGAIKNALIAAIRKYDLRRSIVINVAALPTTNIPTDASGASQLGIPTVSYISGPIYMYDEADTIDKVDASQLVPVTSSFVDVIDRLQRLTLGQLNGSR
jgi:hypothetical protein